jgi:aspartyl-tRNA(Asn)/glutamyl-tRNA(Gln) amidotransferase subunit A
MNEDHICFMSACEITEMIKKQEITSQEITEIVIERIEKVNPAINAFCTTTFELARSMAKEADRRVKNSKTIPLLNGIPTSIKDLVPVKGVRTTYGSKIFENHVPEDDAELVKRLKKAGCVILGKTNTPEFGHKGVTDNLIFGPTRNPWHLERTSGGSSGGAAAAIVSGLGHLAQGSDGGGSIRHPSCFCGAYGLKPSFGRVAMYPRIFISGEDLSVAGPITRYVNDAALMLDVMKGPFEGDRFSLPEEKTSYFEQCDKVPDKLRIGYSLDLGIARVVHSEVEKAVMKSIEKLETYNWVIEEVKFKRSRIAEAFSTNWLITFAYDLKPYLDNWQDKIDPVLVQWVKAGLDFDATALPKAMNMRSQFYQKIYESFKNYDILITPTTAVPAFELGIPAPSTIEGKGVPPIGWQPFTFPFNFTGHPAASIPCGWSSEGTPIGMQIIGKRFQELLVLQISKAFENIAPWQHKRPSFN